MSDKKGEDRKVDLAISNRQIVKSQNSFAKLCNLPFNSARLRYWISKAYKKFEKLYDTEESIEVYKVFFSEIESYEESLTDEQRKDNKFLLTSQDMHHLEQFIDWDKKKH